VCIRNPTFSPDLVSSLLRKEGYGRIWEVVNSCTVTRVEFCWLSLMSTTRLLAAQTHCKWDLLMRV